MSIKRTKILRGRRQKYVCIGAIVVSAVFFSISTGYANVDYANTVYDYHDSGLGRNYYTGARLVGPYGGYTGCVGYGSPVPVPFSVVFGQESMCGYSWLSLPTGSYVTLGVAGKRFNQVIIGEFASSAGEVAEVMVTEDFINYKSAGVVVEGPKSIINLSDHGLSGSYSAVKIIGLDTKGLSPGFDLGSVGFDYKLPEITLIDPIDSNLMFDGAITTNIKYIVKPNPSYESVVGVSADGVSRIIALIPSSVVDENVSVSIMESDGDVNYYGGLTYINDYDGKLSKSVNVKSVLTDVGPMAFVVYRSPVDFSRGNDDSVLKSRSVTLKVTSYASGLQPTKNIDILRPPVVLVHGLWADSSDMINFPLDRSKFDVDLVDYGGEIVGVTSTNPKYGDDFTHIRGSSMGLKYNSPYVLVQIKDIVKRFRYKYSVAAVQADIVAHSMGGLVSRATSLLSDFKTKTYNAGPIHKLITIGTPHLGTPVGTQTLAPDNSCVRETFAGLAGNHVFETVTLSNGQVWNGAVRDLQGDGRGQGMSDELQRVVANKSKEPFPSAYVAGIMNEENVSRLTFNAKSIFLRFWCGTLEGTPLAQSLTPTGWYPVLGQDSDGIVPLTSQINNASMPFTPPFEGVVHSAGTEDLGFAGPNELEAESNIPLKVEALLNDKVRAADFIR